MGNTKEFNKNGIPALLGILFGQVATVLGIIYCSIMLEKNYAVYEHTQNVSTSIGEVILILGIIVCAILCAVLIIAYSGLRIIKPNEAVVLTLFGDFYGVIKEEGFYFVNPFCTSVYPKSEKTIEAKTGEEYQHQVNRGKVSLKAMTLNNRKQKVNDLNGNPIEIGVVVIWKVVNPYDAVFNVEDFREFVSIQSDSSIRTVARKYVYDGNDGKASLTNSTSEISERLKEVIQESVKEAGIKIIDAKIAHLAYAPEIASAMLQRQQADAIIQARQKIVEGAVGMVEQALDDLAKNEVVELDNERKAQMISNLLVVLCANKEPQPIVNSGSIY